MLKDYIKNEWLEAADRCEYCGAKYVTKITWVDETGCVGDVEWRVYHSSECPDLLELDVEAVNPKFIGDFDVAGWEFMKNTVKVAGKEFTPLKSRANIGPCLNCGKLIVGVTLILFINHGKGGELDFCFPCAKKLGLLDNLRGK